MLHATIDRSLWVTGTSSMACGDSALLNGKGYMCCLGHLGLQAGLTPDEISGCAQFDSVTILKERSEKLMNNELSKELFSITDLTLIAADEYRHLSDSKLSCRAITINDDSTISDEEREIELIELFDEFGIELSFFNEFPD